MPDPRYHVILNPNAGTCLALGLTGEILRERFTAAGYEATVDDDAEAPLPERIGRALKSDADIIVAAGGDGTVTAIAEAMVDGSKTLAALPLGTANLLARDLGIPLDLDKAIAALGTMVPKRIDVGEVNGRIFLHNVTIGFITRVAAKRESMRGKESIAAKLGFLRYFFRRLARARRIALEVDPAEGERRVGRVHTVTVANNAYDEGFGQVFSRQQLDDGHLAVYTTKHFNLGDFLRLTAGMIVGRWQEDEALLVENATAVTIRAKARKLEVLLDGEIEKLDVPLKFRIRPLALSVLAPVPAEEIPADAADADEELFAVGA